MADGRREKAISKKTKDKSQKTKLKRGKSYEHRQGL